MKVLEIGLPCSPSKRVEVKEIEATQVLITYGGGMGGANTTVYVTAFGSNDYCTLINGEKMYINPNFIVTKKEVRLVKQVVDTTAHSNYNNRGRFKRTVLSEVFLLEYKQKYIISDQYVQSKKTVERDLEEVYN